jgi:hypothetical protein
MIPIIIINFNPWSNIMKREKDNNVNVDEINIKLWKIKRYFKDPLDQAVGDAVLSREKVVKSANELLGFGQLEPCSKDTFEHATERIKRKLKLVDLEPIRLDKKQIDVPVDGKAATIGRAFYRIGVIGSDKEIDLWLKVELPVGCNFCTYHLTTESPFSK